MKTISSGRTRPWLIVAEDSEGKEYEVLLKLLGCNEITPGKLFIEAFTALLAQGLSIPVEKPYKVEITSVHSGILTFPLKKAPTGLSPRPDPE